ncbi:PLA2G [Lepeophtheirus salmonis]|uniref:PLA2G n=1 Tax=Lepeophtheirus salmonis TaxID=72036 RepID=A0A7R8D0J3_LEPSM|nr:PLA2G [Lepeophtheirus salmonis]CAF2984756.1 PLA2G [Lepeophtheirus salmonis]
MPSDGRLFPIILFFFSIKLVELSTNDLNNLILYFEKTVAYVAFKGNIITNCELFNVHNKDVDGKNKLLKKLEVSKGAHSIQINLKEILIVLEYCQEFDESKRNWCGFGNIAKEFEDLGEIENVDACCRTHDHCPISVSAYQLNYGIFNFHPYTLSHCDCDSMFYRCLNNAEKKNDSVATVAIKNIKKIYFNIAAVKCISTLYPKICIEILTKNGTRLKNKNPKVLMKEKSYFDLLFYVEEKVSRDQPCVKWTIDYTAVPDARPTEHGIHSLYYPMMNDSQVPHYLTSKILKPTYT